MKNKGKVNRNGFSESFLRKNDMLYRLWQKSHPNGCVILKNGGKVNPNKLSAWRDRQVARDVGRKKVRKGRECASRAAVGLLRRTSVSLESHGKPVFLAFTRNEMEERWSSAEQMEIYVRNSESQRVVKLIRNHHFPLHVVSASSEMTYTFPGKHTRWLYLCS